MKKNRLLIIIIICLALIAILTYIFVFLKKSYISNIENTEWVSTKYEYYTGNNKEFENNLTNMNLLFNKSQVDIIFKDEDGIQETLNYYLKDNKMYIEKNNLIDFWGYITLNKKNLKVEMEMENNEKIIYYFQKVK